MSRKIVRSLATISILIAVMTMFASAAWGHGWCTNCMDSYGNYEGYVDYYCGSLKEQYTSTHTHLLQRCTYTGQIRYQYLMCDNCGMQSVNKGTHDCWEYHDVTSEFTYFCNYN